MPLKRVGLALRPNEEGIHDLALTADGNLDMVYDAEAIGQHARQRIGTFAEEWFLDTTAGVPWLERIMGRQYDAALIEAVVKKEIVETDGVSGIESLSVSYNNRTRGALVKDTFVATVYDGQEAEV